MRIKKLSKKGPKFAGPLIFGLPMLLKKKGASPEEESNAKY